jgi:leucine-zipper of insertion element IS481
MNLHANAALSLKGRRALARSVVDGKRTVTESAEAAGVSVRCARKSSTRYRECGEVGLRDRSSAPRLRIPPTSSANRARDAETRRAVPASTTVKYPRERQETPT